MDDKIKKYLAEIEQEKGITILLACETGSRAWGFPSPDSDYDVRVIYKHKTDWYLNLNEGKDSINLMLDNNEIDISGWELRKSLRLLCKSNPPLLERIQSPIIYSAKAEFVKEINELAKKSYSRIATIHHYLSMAKKCYDEINNSPEYKLKKFFYALRTAVTCKWILEKEEIPPIVFQNILDQVDISDSLKNRIQELIELKATSSESYMHSGEIELKSLIKECIDKAEAASKNLPSSKGNMEDLNSFFRKTLED